MCVNCKTGLSYPRGVLEHFIKHNVTAETRKMAMLYLDTELPAALTKGHALRNVYLTTPERVLKDLSMKLKSLSTFELGKGVKRSCCKRFFRFPKHFGKHLKGLGLAENIVVEEMVVCEPIKMQTIFKEKHFAYFPKHVGNEALFLSQLYSSQGIF